MPIGMVWRPPSLHIDQKPHLSITSSARASNVGGIQIKHDGRLDQASVLDFFHFSSGDFQIIHLAGPGYPVMSSAGWTWQVF
jgi:hypothetical protein